MIDETLFSALGGDLISPRVAIDASLPLELSGEAVRGRLCIFTDQAGKEWALRPDITLPAALDEIDCRAGGAANERTVRYKAPVFRLPRRGTDPIEVEQIGFEVFGALSDPETDARLFKSVLEALDRVSPQDNHLKMGDLKLFPAFVDALKLPGDMSDRLKRAFRQEGGVAALLQTQSNPPSSLARRVRTMDKDEIEDFVDDMFAMTGVRPVGLRSKDEIVERLQTRSSQDEKIALPANTRDILTKILNVDDTPEKALSAYRSIAESSGLESALPAIDNLATRLDALPNGYQQSFEAVLLSTSFGRRFTYYDGFVFEIAQTRDDSESGNCFAAGGRYDRLISDLSKGQVDATAFGAVIIPHRLKSDPGVKS